MPSLNDATKPRDTSNLELITRQAPLRQPAVDPSADPEFSPLSIAPIPPVLGTDTDAARQFYRKNVSQLRMPPLPSQAKIAVGAQASSNAQQVLTNNLILQVNGVTNPVQSVLNLTGSGVTYGPNPGQVQIAGGGAGDGLTHSTAPWESDPAYIVLRDDFTQSQSASSTGIQTTGIGQLGFDLFGNAPSHNGLFSGLIPNMGQFYWDNNASANQTSILMLAQNGVLGGNAGSNYGWALFDNPGWQCSWVFRLGGVSAGLNGTQFPFGGKAMYIGLVGNNALALPSATQGQARTETFFGVRYDTSGYYSPGGSYTGATAVTMSGSNMAITGTFPGANQIAGTSWVGLWFAVTLAGNTGNNGMFLCTAATPTTLTLTNPNGVNATVQNITCKGQTPLVMTAAANGNGTQVVYTGAITNGGTNLYVGQMFYVSGFGNAGNNGGPWICTANSTTTITLANPVATGSAETHAGYVGGPRLGDTQLVLEAVVNPSYGSGAPTNYTQGVTLATGISPITGSQTWHRLDIVCNKAGSITLTLDGSSINTLTAAVNKLLITVTGSGLTGSVGTAGAPAELLNLTWTPTGGTIPNCPWGAGSQVTVTGFSGAQAGFNSTFTAIANQTLAGANLLLMYTPATTPVVIASSGVNGTLTGYPTIFPAAIFGNDNISTPANATATFWVDFFSFVWNPNLGPNAPGTPIATKPRFW